MCAIECQALFPELGNAVDAFLRLGGSVVGVPGVENEGTQADFDDEDPYYTEDGDVDDEDNAVEDLEPERSLAERITETVQWLSENGIIR